MPLFHPAAALYNGSLRQTLIDDFLKIPTVIRQIDTPASAILAPEANDVTELQ